VKKKIILLLLTAAALISIPCIAACGGHEHSFKETVVAPTCTEKGYTLHECGCGDNYKDNYVNASGHDYVYFTCAKCGDEGSDIPDTEGLEFSLDRSGESYSVSGVGTAEGDILKIPATYNGLPVTGVDWWSYYEYRGFTSVFIPASLTSFSVYTFDLLNSLENISVSSSNKYYSSLNGVLYNKNKTRIVRVPQTLSGDFEIPYGVTVIGYETFINCRNLTSVTIPYGVTSIEKWAFYGCRGLTGIIIPDSVKEMGDWAFRSCSGLESVTIGKGLTDIPVCAFDDCTNLTSVTVPNGVIAIGAYAFASCEKLTEITIPESVTAIDYNVLNDCPCLERITVSDNNKNYCSENGILYSKDKTRLLRVPATLKGSFTVPDGITAIDNGAFSDCSELTGVKLPEELTEISDRTFYECKKLASIKIPDSVTRIGDYAFTYCSSLINVTIPEKVTSIGKSAFSLCSGLTGITLPEGLTEISDSVFALCSNLTDITIPQTVKTIGKYAFAGCYGLTNITIPKSVTSMGKNVFSGCRNLKDIYFDGTKEEWEVVAKDNNWIITSYGTTIHCSDGDLANEQ